MSAQPARAAGFVMQGAVVERWQPVPKIAAALLTAVAVVAIVAVAALVGIDLVDDAATWMVIIGAALAPAVAGYIKRDV